LQVSIILPRCTIQQGKKTAENFHPAVLEDLHCLIPFLVR
jgi:hypothetical protein